MVPDCSDEGSVRLCSSEMGGVNERTLGVNKRYLFYTVHRQCRFVGGNGTNVLLTNATGRVGDQSDRERLQGNVPKL
jgi:hypothetical protein